MTGLLLGDPINLLIAIFAMSFLFLCGVVAGRWSTHPRKDEPIPYPENVGR